MSKQKTSLNQMLRENKGFTLVEMAIVLILIGIIIGAVVKGKDLVRGAEQKKIYSKFLNEWRLKYLNFYDRTGLRLGDFNDGAALAQDGQCDTDEDIDSAVTDTERGYLATGDPGAGMGFRGLDDVGLDVPVTNVSGSPFQYNYTDSAGTTQSIVIAFMYNAAPSYNYMEIAGIPNELALAIDTMVDGVADGTAGDFFDGGGVDWGAPTATTTARWRMQF